MGSKGQTKIRFCCMAESPMNLTQDSDLKLLVLNFPQSSLIFDWEWYVGSIESPFMNPPSAASDLFSQHSLNVRQGESAIKNI